MSFKHFPEQAQGVELLQRSLQRGRLAHAYLFTGHHIDELEAIARTLAKTLNCLKPIRVEGAAVDSCDVCGNCQKVAADSHPDVHWVRPESKSRVVTVDQMRELMQQIYLKPNEGEYKVAIIAGADRLNVQAANAFLKTLEEPPAKSVLILLSIESQRLLETILSRCLRLNFSGDGPRPLTPAEMEWLSGFSDVAAADQKSLIGRYRLMDRLMQKLTEMKAAIEENLTARSPLERHEDIEKDLREKWEEELKAAIEAEYRRQRSDLLMILQRWLRDVWLHTLAVTGEQTQNETAMVNGLLNFPQLASEAKVAQRLKSFEALENLETMEGTQRLLHTNVQEALALEVGLLKLHL